MSEFQTNMSILTKKVVDARVKGHTLEETAEVIGITVEEAVIEWKNYVANRQTMPKEEQWILMLLRLENLLVRANEKLQYSTELTDFEQVLKILDRIEALQSLNLSRKEEAQAEADKLYRLQAEQVVYILEMSKMMMQGMIEKAFQSKTLKAAKASVLEDLGELTSNVLEEMEVAEDE